jgi:hypothetical protein
MTCTYYAWTFFHETSVDGHEKDPNLIIEITEAVQGQYCQKYVFRQMYKKT